ncbi:MAG: GNAT family N-acetyltransferase [Candidatus Sericytochromatia bacterium]
MNIRLAKIEELNEIYMMGYDTWSYGASKKEYLAICQNSQKYKLGNWYILTNDKKDLLSAAIIYSSVFNIPNNFCGIGSIVTNPNFRKKGYASKLINEICLFLEKRGIKGLYLYSDIGALFYKNLNFITLFEDKEICMLRLFNSLEEIPKNKPFYF